MEKVGLVVAVVALIIALASIMLSYFIERVRKPKLIVSTLVPTSDLLDTTAKELTWCVVLKNIPNSGCFRFVGRQTAKDVRVRLDIQEGPRRLFAEEFGDAGVELSILELPPNIKHIWKIKDLPIPRLAIADIVPNRHYLVPIVYKLSEKMSCILVDQHDKREGKHELPEAKQYKLYLKITGENVNSEFPFILTNEGYSFHTFTLQVAKVVKTKPGKESQLIPLDKKN